MKVVGLNPAFGSMMGAPTLLVRGPQRCEPGGRNGRIPRGRDLAPGPGKTLPPGHAGADGPGRCAFSQCVLSAVCVPDAEHPRWAIFSPTALSQS